MFFIKSLNANLDVLEREFRRSKQELFSKSHYNYERSFRECGGISISSFKLYSAAYTNASGVSH